MAQVAACFLGNWNSPFRRFRRRQGRAYLRFFNAISGDHDLDDALIDGAIFSVHKKPTGAKMGLKLRPSCARGGLTIGVCADCPHAPHRKRRY